MSELTWTHIRQLEQKVDALIKAVRAQAKLIEELKNDRNSH
jgi:hypothetical protein